MQCVSGECRKVQIQSILLRSKRNPGCCWRTILSRMGAKLLSIIEAKILFPFEIKPISRRLLQSPRVPFLRMGTIIGPLIGNGIRFSVASSQSRDVNTFIKTSPPSLKRTVGEIIEADSFSLLLRSLFEVFSLRIRDSKANRARENVS